MAKRNLKQDDISRGEIDMLAAGLPVKLLGDVDLGEVIQQMAEMMVEGREGYQSLSAHNMDRYYYVRELEKKVQWLLRELEVHDKRGELMEAHADWSDATFGNVGPIGPLKHLVKEVEETIKEPGDLSEWADMQMLLWDAQRRAKIPDGVMMNAIEKKLEENKARSWGKAVDGEPCRHVTEPRYDLKDGWVYVGWDSWREFGDYPEGVNKHDRVMVILRGGQDYGITTQADKLDWVTEDLSDNPDRTIIAYKIIK